MRWMRQEGSHVSVPLAFTGACAAAHGRLDDGRCSEEVKRAPSKPLKVLRCVLRKQVGEGSLIWSTVLVLSPSRVLQQACSTMPSRSRSATTSCVRSPSP